MCKANNSTSSSVNSIITNSSFSMGAVFQKWFKSGAGSTHLADSANHIFLVPQVC